MSTLSWSIIALVVVVLVIVIAHNLWQNHRSNQQAGRLGLRKGHFEDEPDTLIGTGRRGRQADVGRDRRDPVLAGSEGGRQVPPSLVARPARLHARDDDGRDSDADLHRHGLRRGDEDAARYPSLGVDDEDFVETPFENPAAVRPWSSSEDAASRRARQAATRPAGPHFQDDDAHAPRRGLRDDEAPVSAARPDWGDDHAPAGRQGAEHAGSYAGAHAFDDAGRAGGQGRAAGRGDYQPFVPPSQQAARAAAAAGGAGVRDAHADERGLSGGLSGGPDWHVGEGAGLADRHGDDAHHSRSGLSGHQSAFRDEGDDQDEGFGHGERTHHAVDEAGHADAARAWPEADDGEAGEVGEVGEVGEAAAPLAAGEADEGAAELPDAVVEHVVILEPPAPVNTDRLVVLTSSLRHVGSKPVRIEVERLGGHWTTLTAGEKAVRLRCSLLLANRQGPLNAVELSDFNAAIESLASQLQAPVSIPDMAPILRNARDLDTLAARLDTQVEVRVELPEAAEAGRVSALVRQLGLSERGNGRYEAYADSGDLLFALAFNKTRDQIDFVLDVPRTAERHEAWEGMVACASSMAQALGGRLVDSSGRGMSVGMIKAVARQLAQRHAQLAQVGLPAGGAAAMRVFH